MHNKKIVKLDPDVHDSIAELDNLEKPMIMMLSSALSNSTRSGKVKVANNNLKSHLLYPIYQKQ